jgi:SAM-dependent methyltransferase
MTSKLARHGEAWKHHETRLKNGFYDKFMQGSGLDIGPKYEPVLPGMTGVDLNYPGYDGIKLPFADESQDYVFSSHMIEHVPVHNLPEVIKEWFRVTKVGGHIVVVAPHWFLYEKKLTRPSRYNGDHKSFYTPGLLLKDFETAYAPNTYRVRWLRDNDDGFDYKLGPDKHSVGGYEIELVLQKIKAPEWKIL